MRNRSKLLFVYFLVMFLFAMVTFSGIPLMRASAENSRIDRDDEDEDSPQQINKDDDEENDADVPQRFRHLIDKDEYLQLRSAYVNKLRGVPYNSKINPRGKAIAEMESQEISAPQINLATWESVGPAPIPNGQTSPSTAVSGRTISIAVHPTNPNIVYVGTANGGVYRTTDGGTTWKAIFDTAQSLAIGAIAISPSQPTTIYVGTGEPSFSCDSFFGVGVYRITNADTTPTLAGPFNQDGSAVDVMSGRAIGKIVVHPTDPNIIFVSTTSGIGGIGCDQSTAQPSRGLFRSTNAAGVSPTFTKLTVGTENGGNRSISDIVMEPGNPDNLLCTVLGFSTAGSGGVYRTTNALAVTPTFTRTLTVGTGAATFRTELAINKIGMVTTVYAAIGEPSGITSCNNAQQSGTLKKSTDGGITWSTALSGGNGFCGGQCSYNISLAVDPNNASNVILGGNVNSTCSKLSARSTDGGTTFTNTASGVHADNHVAVFAPSNSTIAYMGTDGGIYKSTNSGAAWTSMSNSGFNATQFQSLALHPTDREFMIGGTQDNGTELKRANGTWTRADFGDGGFALIDQSATDTTTVTMYHTYFNQTNNLIAFARVNTSACATEGQWAVRGIFGGAPDPTPVCDGSVGEIFNGIGLTDAVEFYAPMALGPGTPNTLYFGTDRLYRSINRGDLMTTVSQGPIEAGQTVTAIGISAQNDNVRIVGLSNGHVYRTTTGANPLNNVTGSIPGNYVARAVIDPTNSNTAYVTLAGFGLAAGQHVWKTTNLNNAAPTWTASGTGIPDVPVNAFVVDPSIANNLYAGTDIGVYRSTDGGANWSPFSNGLPRVPVFDMAIQNPNRVLRISTHGRGIWEISLSLFTLAKLSESFNPSGGMGTVAVSGPNGPTWTATTTDSWITINSPGPGTGSGSVTYTVASNPASTRRIGTITIANQTFTVLQGATFADVPVGAAFYNEIGKLSARGVTLGCGGNNYCPSQVVTRDQMAAFVIRSLGDFDPPTPPSQRFTDVPPNQTFYAFIEQMALRQITLGCGGGNYCPSDSVTREQMAAFIIRGLGEFNPPTPATQRFNDVPPSNIFYNFIDRMAVLQITLGCSASPPLYCPTSPVTRDQMAAFLVRAYNL